MHNFYLLLLSYAKHCFFLVVLRVYIFFNISEQGVVLIAWDGMQRRSACTPCCFSLSLKGHKSDTDLFIQFPQRNQVLPKMLNYSFLFPT